MSRRAVVETVGGLVLLAAGFVAGGFVGAGRAVGVITSAMRAEVMFGTGLRVNQLALLRAGETERAVRLIEGQIDGALVSVTASWRQSGVPWTELPKPERQALLLAKLYRQLYPPERPVAAIASALAAIPDEPIDWGRCKPPIRKLLERPKPE
jgi:hypothetical protein